jgi:shikimate 5-dehydrogenase
MLIGAGGAGGAIADALAEGGAAITLFDLEQGKANSLAHQIRKSHPACEIRVGAATADGHDLLINATPIGMVPSDGLPLELPSLAADVFVIDVVTKPEVTPLLAHARAKGCRTMGGRMMMEGQAELIAGFFSAEV